MQPFKTFRLGGDLTKVYDPANEKGKGLLKPAGEPACWRLGQHGVPDTPPSLASQLLQGIVAVLNAIHPSDFRGGFGGAVGP